MNNLTEIILDFSKDLIEKVDGIVKSIILFGSYAENKDKEKSDIDVLILVDDVYAENANISIQFYLDNLNKVLSNEKYRKIHPTTITLSKFWEMLYYGDPLILKILKSGKPIIDPMGMFKSFQLLLEKGIIRNTPESLHIIKKRIEYHENLYDLYIKKALESILNIVVDSSHYFFSSINQEPIGVDEIPIKLEENRKKYKIPKKIIDIFIEIYNYVKKVEYKEITNIDLNDIKELHAKAIEYKKFFIDLVDKINKK